ncbi:MAG: hypothetical protein J0L47_08835 [Flavobacteriales bacterium]|nr:hypothetical protein [Flavobacteriales bacterium]MCA0390188.1 hypothetical protein [Bacteroidota bacterium]
MKKLFLLFIFISGFAFGQMENFVVNDGQVQWQKVYETTKTFDEIQKAVKNKNNVKITEQTENTIIGEFKGLIMDYRKAGHTYMGTPIVLNETNKYYGLFKIEFKDGKYRATIRNVASEGMTMTMYGAGLGLGSDLDTTLETMVLNKKGEVRKGFAKVAGKIIDVTFIDLMDFNKTEINNDNW